MIYYKDDFAKLYEGYFSNSLVLLLTLKLNRYFVFLLPDILLNFINLNYTFKYYIQFRFS